MFPPPSSGPISCGAFATVAKVFPSVGPSWSRRFAFYLFPSGRLVSLRLSMAASNIRRIALKVIDQRGNELIAVKKLEVTK